MEKKVCVVGAGRWGRNHIRTLNELNSLDGIVETNIEIIDEIKSQFPKVHVFMNLEEALLHGFDGFIVSTPSETHYNIAKKILKSGNHILVEKPLTTNLEDAIKLNKLAKSYNVNLMVGHVLLFHPAFIKMKKMIKNGELGYIQYIYSNRLNLGTIRTQENVLWSFAPHDIAIFQDLIGCKPISINSIGNDVVQDGIHDTTITTLEFPNKIMGHIFVSWLHPFKEHRFVLIGSKGMIHFEDSIQNKPLVFYDKNIKWNGKIPIPETSHPKYINYKKSAPLKEELKYFIDHLDGTSIMISNGDSAVDAMETLSFASNKLSQNEL